MQEEIEPRNERHTLMLTQSEVNDVKLVAALYNTYAGILLREWAMKDIRAEAETLRIRLVTVAATEASAQVRAAPGRAAGASGG